MAIRECDYCTVTDTLTVNESGNEVHTVVKIGDNYACPSHIKDAELENKSVSSAPINVNDVLKQAKQVDMSIQLRTDIFNAETVAINDIKLAIVNDETITNKPYRLAEIVKERHIQFSKLISEKNQELLELNNKQRADQTYLNQLANQLRADEREKLKIQDINYNPRPVKMPVTAKTIKMSKQKIDAKALKGYASELGIPEFTLRMVAIQKNLNAEGVYKLFKANIEAAKSQIKPVESTPVEVVEEVVDMTGIELENN